MRQLDSHNKDYFLLKVIPWLGSVNEVCILLRGGDYVIEVR
jgi:hypothetical protein